MRPRGSAILGVFGLALLLVYSIVLIPFTPSIADLLKAKIDQPERADVRRWTAIGDA